MHDHVQHGHQEGGGGGQASPRLVRLCWRCLWWPGVQPGGWSNVALEDPATSVHAYNPDIDSWVNGPALPMAMSAMAAAELIGSIFVCGGWLRIEDEQGGHPTNGSLLMLDPRTRAWATLPAMPTPVHAHAAVVAGRMYVSGGATDEAGRATAQTFLQSYDLVAGRWDTSCVPMAQARMAHAVAALHGEVWALGGQWWGADQSYHRLASVEVYSPQLITWRSGVSLPHVWQGGACAVVQC